MDRRGNDQIFFPTTDEVIKQGVVLCCVKAKSWLSFELFCIQTLWDPNFKFCLQAAHFLLSA